MPAVQPPPVEKNKLLAKENQQFKTIVKLYENKTYKKALKNADSLIKARPDHGETMAMRALIHSGMGKKEEAHADAKKAISLNLNSFLCWHAYGLIHRADRNYAQAIKCYQNALKRETENDKNLVLRDMATLQIQIRDLEGYTETWRRLLKENPRARNNWLCFAIGEHLSGNHTKALDIVDSYLGATEVVDSFETSELYMYRNQLLEESEKYQEALDHLAKVEGSILDKFALKEKRAFFLTKLGRFDEAIKQYEVLLNDNPDNHNYHRGFQAAHQLPADSSEWSDLALKKFTQVYEELKVKFPRSDAVVFFPLHTFKGEQLRKVLDEYARKKIRRGVPSLFQDLKGLYSNEEKLKVVENLFRDYESNLSKSGKFLESDSEKENPDAVMWVKFFLAQHYNFTGDYSVALSLVDEVIKHTPTLVEAYLVKASILKNGGNAETAAEVADYAREMDLADRYLNNEAAKYHFYAGNHEKALKTLGLFTKEGEEPGNYLDDMQCMWYETSLGKSFVRKNDPGMALKKLLLVNKHFEDIIDDQLDFHSYCLRKMTLRSYIHMIRMEDKINSHHYYVRGMKPLLQTYIRLHDDPVKTKEQMEKDKVDAMTEPERKKYLTKKRAEERKKVEAEEKKKAESKGKQPQPESKKKEDNDPVGEKLATVEDKMAEANKYLSILKRHASNLLSVQLLAFDVAIRSKKHLLALQALSKSSSLSPQHPEVHRQTVRFFSEVAKLEMSGVKKEIIEEGKQKFLGGKSLSDFNSEFLQKNKASYSHRVAAADSLLLLDSSKQSEANALFNDLSNARGRKDLKAAKRTLDYFNRVDQKAAETFKSKANQVFALSRDFMNQQQLDALNAKPEASDE
eukprot:TRINITY_DN2400_c0_g1_i1.p1 TRINITY_DN2400_c0_g1~~TRINITY_DN2400_c0_g1_i1.p1  ORF type:complete len:856 (-),score=378.74 TRINITY_DN2400_c0_g1_i1:75-2642(-)